MFCRRFYGQSMIFQDLCSKPGSAKECLRKCEILVFDEGADNSIMESLACIILFMNSVGTTKWAASGQNQQCGCAPSEDSDQPGLLPSLIRVVWSESSLSAWRKPGSLATHWAHSEDSDQTGRMPRLIWVFAGRTCHFVGFVMRRLKWNNSF